MAPGRADLWSFVDHKLVSAISCGCLGGTILAPLVCPHIGHFITDPDEAHQGNATKLLHYVEIEILTKLLHAPAVTLGTAKSHPWLAAMYRHLGFTEVGEKQLAGKKHVTVYFKKNCKGIIPPCSFLFVTNCPNLLGTIEKTYLPGSRRTK